MTYYPDYARLIQDALERLDRSPSWLAKRLGRSPSTISRWLNEGARPRTPEEVVRVADVLGLSEQRQVFLEAAGYSYREGPERRKGEFVLAGGNEDSAVSSFAERAGELERAPHNLPAQVTPMLGREQELNDILQRLQDPTCRLLTLIGPGGIGKTRLAIAAAASQELPVVYVPLQAVSSAELLPTPIADAAGIVLAGHDPLQVQLLKALRGKRLLLVLDNFEHLLAASDLLGKILRQAPSVKLLLTSREALGVRGEWLYPVSGLPVPAPDDEADAETFAAVRLFDERARQVWYDFRLEDEVEAVISICRQVEGMPLAIELAASWLTVLDCVAIASRLRHGLELLSTPLRNAPERHQSMAAVFDQSWQMLGTEERDTFMRLTVFQGGFTVQAAAEVADATLPILSTLVAKTLVRREPNGRYQIHELLRQYGNEKLTLSPTLEAAAHHAHGVYFLRFLADRSLEFRGPRQRQVAQDVGNELENVRKAWQWAVEHLESEWIREAGSALISFCQFRSRYLEGADLFLKAARRLETDSMTVARGTALVETWQRYGLLCLRLGRLDDADRALARSSQLHDELDIPPRSLLDGYPFVAALFVALARGDYARATRLGERTLDAVEKLGEPNAAIAPQYGLASAALSQNDYLRARTHASKGLALALSSGDQWNAAHLHGILGQVALVEDDLQTANHHFEAAYKIGEQLADRGGMAEHIANLANIALLRQEWPEAIGLFRHSHQLYEEIGDRGGIARAQLGMGRVSHKTHEQDAARGHFRRALAVAVEAQVTPVIVAVLAAVGDFLLPDSSQPALGLRLFSFVLRHPSCDAQMRGRVLDSLARRRDFATELEPSTDSLEDLVAALQSELAAPADDTTLNASR